jgi:hypothetical protein
MIFFEPSSASAPAATVVGSIVLYPPFNPLAEFLRAFEMRTGTGDNRLLPLMPQVRARGNRMRLGVGNYCERDDQAPH